MLNIYPVAVRRSLFDQDDRIILVFFSILIMQVLEFYPNSNYQLPSSELSSFFRQCTCHEHPMFRSTWHLVYMKCELFFRWKRYSSLKDYIRVNQITVKWNFVLRKRTNVCSVFKSLVVHNTYMFFPSYLENTIGI